MSGSRTSRSGEVPRFSSHSSSGPSPTKVGSSASEVFANVPPKPGMNSSGRSMIVSTPELTIGFTLPAAFTIVSAAPAPATKLVSKATPVWMIRLSLPAPASMSTAVP